MSLEWSIDTPDEHGPATASARGKVTEKADFSALIALAAERPLVLELAGVRQISSTGVREWILFMRALSQQPHPVELHAVSPTLVRQLNAIANFGGDATIRSVVLPYYCDACGHEQSRLLALDGDRSIPPEQPCEHCSEQAEFDDIASSYLAFVT